MAPLMRLVLAIDDTLGNQHANDDALSGDLCCDRKPGYVSARQCAAQFDGPNGVTGGAASGRRRAPGGTVLEP